jgi:Fe-S cluster assembly protein SufD
MTGLAEQWSEALSLAPQAPGPDWLRELRESAAGQFRAAGLPHRKVEAWKYTPMRALEGLLLAPPEPVDAPSAKLPPPLFEGASIVDIRDGVLGALPEDLPEGVSLLTLAEGLERFEDRLKPLFEAVDLQGATRAFAALNTALAQQGLVVHVTGDRTGSEEVARLLLRWGFSSGSVSLMGHFRLFILLDDGASLELAEQFTSAAGDSGQSGGLNVLCQAELGAGATLGHTRVQAAPDEAVLLATSSVGQAQGSRYRYRGFDLGGALARLELTTRLCGPGAEADLAGAWLLDGRRHADNHICVEHLDGRSRGVFNGRALIQAGADGSSVRQSNANLLLSPLAEMDTKPELEIYADEVEASHGATVGQLDEDAVFYLRSRGLSDDASRRILTAAFCRAVTDRVADRDMAKRIEELLDRAMPGSEL